MIKGDTRRTDYFEKSPHPCSLQPAGAQRFASDLREALAPSLRQRVRVVSFT